MITIDFFVTALIVVLIPGTGVIFTISTGLAMGRRASVFAALGCTLGILPHLLATVFGVAAILHMSAVAFQTLKLLGAAYLLYIAYATWREKQLLAIEQTSMVINGKGLVIKAFLMNILNPKLSIFFLAFLPQFVEPNTSSHVSQMLTLSGTFMLLTFVVFIMYGVLADRFRRVVIDSPRVQAWLRRGFSATFAGLGLNLALSEQ